MPVFNTYRTSLIVKPFPIGLHGCKTVVKQCGILGIANLKGMCPHLCANKN